MTMPLTQFEVTPEHITLLRHAVVRWEDGEYGAPAIDCKRPYGNSGVEFDVAEILRWVKPNDYDALTDEMRERASAIHAATEHALQIFLSTGEMKPGRYVRVSYNEWRPAHVG